MWAIIRPDAISVLKDEKCKESLSRYFDVFQDKKYAKFMIAKKLPVDFKANNSLDELWKIHEEATKEYYELEDRIDRGELKFEDLKFQAKSYLDLKIEISRKILESCHFCVRNDKPNRLKGELGFCKCGYDVKVSTYFEHMGEEPELVPSGTIFTLGCTLRCLHCQNWTISQWYEVGEIYKPEELARVVERLRANGCRNANLVGGEPTPWLERWLQTFKHVKVNVPVVWNSNSYYSQETAKLLAGFIDVYLLDFKYGKSKCSEKISFAPKYWEACTKNHLMAKSYGELIIRVLVLPNHNECCTRPILEWIAKNLGVNTRVNLMDQYRPEWRAYEIPELRRRLTRGEFSEAVKIAKEVGLLNFIT
ncbi:MAG: radical SAM protein [Candidatus Bathyarchaeia archaeon]